MQQANGYSNNITRHVFDVHPVPKDASVLFVNEPWLMDGSIDAGSSNEPEWEADNVRIYVPLDINRSAILRRLAAVILEYGEAGEDNELAFSVAVDRIVYQLEIYDQLWYARHMPKRGKHSAEGISLAADFVKMLEEIPDNCAETFPFELIDKLKEEYLEIER